MLSAGILNIAKKAAYNAAKVIQSESRKLDKIEISTKGYKDYVTNVDKKSEEIIIKTIQSAYPNHNILAEESGNAYSSDSNVTWIIDPIDGTTNFIHGHPNYSISIAIAHDGEITHGVILDPSHNDVYVAQLGRGAYLNDTRIRVSSRSNFAQSLIGCGHPGSDEITQEKFYTLYKQFHLQTSGQRRLGSAALDLAYVACGHVDGFWEFNLKPWDFAAGVLLVKEAGGLVSDFNKKNDFWENGNILAANPKIYNHMSKLINQHLK